MVVYQPPDTALITVGAAQSTEDLVTCGRRLLPLAQRDHRVLEPFGIGEEDVVGLKRLLNELSGMARDPKLMKNDHPVQMTEVPETMARIRGWLRTLRLIGGLNLSLDTPALMRLASPAPEIAEGHPRDLLEELDRRLAAAADLKPRLEEVGLDDGFLGRGRRLRATLATAIGKTDIDGANLSMPVRRLYHRKARTYLLLKRIHRAGKLAFGLLPKRASLYHLREIEPVRPEPAKAAVRPKSPPEG